MFPAPAGPACPPAGFTWEVKNNHTTMSAILNELPIGAIFEVPSMPQWGIMMVSLNRATKTKMLVSLTGNRWAHEISILDEQLQVTRLQQVEFILSRIRRY